MYIDLNLFFKIQEATFTQYDNIAIVKDKEMALITSETIESMLEDLICEIDVLKEKYQDLQDDLENNYEKRAINYYDEYGLNREDF